MGKASHAVSVGRASCADKVGKASYAVSVGRVSYAVQVGEASHAVRLDKASHAVTAGRTLHKILQPSQMQALTQGRVLWLSCGIGSEWVWMIASILQLYHHVRLPDTQARLSCLNSPKMLFSATLHFCFIS